MIISLIAAVDQSNGIGRDGVVPWRLSTDLKWFKNTTMGHHIIMGRKTFESIGSALPGRTSIILSRNLDYAPKGALVVNSLDKALKLASERGEAEVFIIGGGEVFAQSLALADRLYLTRVHDEFDCDVFFPHLNLDEWSMLKTEPHPQGEKNQSPFTFQVLERKQ